MISIIIPNYNGEELIKKNLPKIFSAIQEDAEVIVVDDASTDKSVEYLQSLGDKVHLLVNSKNLGFARSVNRAVQESSGEIIVLLNSDVSPRKEFLQFLVPHFKNETVFAVGCMDESIENGKTVLRGRGIGKWEKGFLVHSAGSLDKNNTLWANGGSGAFRKNIWKKLGGFSEAYNPFYWEDIDLSYRAWKAGYEVMFEKNSVVVHEHEKGAIKKKFSKDYVLQIAYKNQFIFVWKNISAPSLLIDHIFWLPYHFINAVKSKNTNFIIGFTRALLQLPSVLLSRFLSSFNEKKSDKEILQLFRT